MNTTIKPDRVLYVTMGVLLAVLLIGAGGFLWLSSGGRNSPLGIGGPFTLRDGNGQTVTDKDFRGKYMLVYFGYTFCPDVCPTTLNAVADAMDKLGPAASSIQPLFSVIPSQTKNLLSKPKAEPEHQLFSASSLPLICANVAS